jgi:hypothetical protein
MKLTTKTAEFSLDSRGFVRVLFLDNDETFDEEEAKEHIKAGAQLAAGKPMPILIDLRQSYHVPTVEAKKIIAQNKLKIAEAILCKSLAHRIIGNFYIRLVKSWKSTAPVKIFCEEEDAITWLFEQTQSYQKSHPRFDSIKS